MLPKNNLSKLLGVAALTTATCLTALWPHATLAEGDIDPMQELEGDGTKLDHVVVTGEIVRDGKSKTGWVVELKAENSGGDAETVALETDLERTVSNTMSRAEPAPTTVWKKTETLTIAAGESVTRRYTVPAGIGAQLSASARVEARNAKQENNPNARYMPVMTRFAVAFQKDHA